MPDILPLSSMLHIARRSIPEHGRVQDMLPPAAQAERCALATDIEKKCYDFLEVLDEIDRSIVSAFPLGATSVSSKDLKVREGESSESRVVGRVSEGSLCLVL